MHTAAQPSDLEAALAKLDARPAKPAVRDDRALMWSVQAQSDAAVAHVPAIKTAMYVTLQDGSQAFAGYSYEVGPRAVAAQAKAA